MVGVLRFLLGMAKSDVMDVPSFEDVDVGPWQRKGTSLYKRFLYRDGANLVLEVEIGVERSEESRLIQRIGGFHPDARVRTERTGPHTFFELRGRRHRQLDGC